MLVFRVLLRAPECSVREMNTGAEHVWVLYVQYIVSSRTVGSNPKQRAEVEDVNAANSLKAATCLCWSRWHCATARSNSTASQARPDYR
jgi:hypothetical protein